jgi:streptomycin 6-kinase
MSLFLLERLHARYDAEEAWQLMRTGKGGTVAKSRPIQRSDVEVVGIPVAQRWLDCHGQQARTWLNHIPAIVDSWAQRWHLVVGEPLEGGSVSVVYSVERDDGPAVLKLAAPWSRWPEQEAAALRAWGGHGAIRLLAASDDASALLLERVRPGTPAIGMTAVELAGLLTTLSRAAMPSGMPLLAEAIHLRFDRAEENRHGLLSAAQIRRARCAGVERAGVPRGSPITCHGDLSIKNILVSDDRGPLVIDPNPCAGHLAYDAAQWALTQTPVAEAPQRAAAVAAALGIPTDDVQRWVGVLVAVEVCLASLSRAQASLELARRLNAGWLRDGG